MRLRWAIMLAALVISTAPIATEVAEGATSVRPVSGWIVSVNPNTRIVELGPMTFYVPPGVHDLGELEEGVKAVIHYRQEGSRLVATSIETSDLTE